MKYIIDKVYDYLPNGFVASRNGYILRLNSQCGILRLYDLVGYVLEDWEYEAIDSSKYLIQDKLDQIQDYFIKYRFGDHHLEWNNSDYFISLRMSSSRIWNLQVKYENQNFYIPGGYNKIEEFLDEINDFVNEINAFVKQTSPKYRINLGHGYHELRDWNIPLLTIK